MYYSEPYEHIQTIEQVSLVAVGRLCRISIDTLTSHCYPIKTIKSVLMVTELTEVAEVRMGFQTHFSIMPIAPWPLMAIN